MGLWVLGIPAQRTWQPRIRGREDAVRALTSHHSLGWASCMARNGKEGGGSSGVEIALLRWAKTRHPTSISGLQPSRKASQSLSLGRCLKPGAEAKKRPSGTCSGQHDASAMHCANLAASSDPGEMSRYRQAG